MPEGAGIVCGRVTCNEWHKIHREFFRVKELEVEDWTIWWIQVIQSSSLRPGTRLNSPMLCEIMVISLDTPWAAI